MVCRFLENIIHFFIRLSIKKNLYSYNNNECIICMEFNKDIIFYPCKHYYCCKSCSKSINLCPICRSIIIFKIKDNI